MPRLSNYKPERGNDYKFIDKTIYEQFQIGGVDVFFHKYLGPADPSDPNKATSPTTIQDVLFLENRDRKYDPTVYVMRGVYNVQDIDFNLSQFGLFLQNDTIFMTVHINNSVETMGRKIMSGDVIELPHLIDDFAANNFAYGLKRFYVVEEINRAAEGFSVTWWPHLYRLKLKPIVDSQEFKDILDTPQNADNYAGDYDSSKTYYPGQVIKSAGVLYTVTAQCTNTEPPNAAFFTTQDPSTNLRAMMSTFSIEQLLNDSVVAAAEADAPAAGYSTKNYYTLALDEKGKAALTTVDNLDINIDDVDFAGDESPAPLKSGYKGYMLGQGTPPNGLPFGFGIAFPPESAIGDFYLRTDYLPNRMFRFNGSRWTVFEEDVKMTLTNTDTRYTQKTGFINNTNITGIQPIARDTVIVRSSNVFESNDSTAELDLANSIITTRTPYDVKINVKVFVNQTNMPTKGVVSNNGLCSFQTEFVLMPGDVVTWTLYKESVPQRQALSKALLPKADF
jgi:hypothetical protein